MDDQDAPVARSLPILARGIHPQCAEADAKRVREVKTAEKNGKRDDKLPAPDDLEDL